MILILSNSTIILDSEMNVRYFFNHIKKLVHSTICV